MTFFDLNLKSPEGHTDRTPDIIWRDSSTGQYAVWYMEGSTPTESSSLATQPGSGWMIASASDFNGDGKTDILWRNISTGENRIWYMDGTKVTGTHDLNTVPDLNRSIAGTGVFKNTGK